MIRHDDDTNVIVPTARSFRAGFRAGLNLGIAVGVTAAGIVVATVVMVFG